MPRPRKTLSVSPEDRQVLEGHLRRRTTPRRVLERAQVVLLFADGVAGPEIAEKTGLSARTIFEWARRFERDGLSGLDDRPRSGRPRKMTASKARQILDLTIHRIPKESTHWSLRLMGKEVGVSQHQVAEVWKAAQLKPHRLKNFKISRDPHFALEKVNGENYPSRALVERAPTDLALLYTRSCARVFTKYQLCDRVRRGVTDSDGMQRL